MQPGERWITAAGALVLVVGTRTSRTQHETDGRAESPTVLLITCVVIAMIGIAMLIGAGASMLAGDLILRGFGPPSGWVTPPVVFVLGLVLALAPIWLLRRPRDRWIRQQQAPGDPPPAPAVSLLSLHPTGVIVHEGPATGRHRWDETSADLLAALPPIGRTVVRHYVEHPDHRTELGTPAGQERAESLTSPTECGE